MRFLTSVFTILILVCSWSAQASAQQVLDGVYDARELVGWQYHRAMSMLMGISIWFPENQGDPPDGANCNIIVLPLTGTTDEYRQAYERTTVDSYFATLNRLNPQTTGVLRVSYFEYNDRRPAVMAAYTSVSEGYEMQHVSLEVAGPNRNVTITCTARLEFYDQRHQDFAYFVSSVQIVTE